MAEIFNLKSIEFDIGKFMKKNGLNEGGRVQKIIDSECLRLMDPYVPKDTGQLIRSGKQNTNIGSGKIVYQTPYARKQYYIPMEHTESRCAYWFEKMKNEGGKEKILNAARGAMK